MANTQHLRIQSISEIHRLMDLPKPQHPLIGVIDLAGLQDTTGAVSVLLDLYVVSLKRGCDKLIYGQQKYDFDEGLMAFMAPGQVLRGEPTGMPPRLEGWMLFIHPDFFMEYAAGQEDKAVRIFWLLHERSPISLRKRGADYERHSG